MEGCRNQVGHPGSDPWMRMRMKDEDRILL